VKILFGKIVRGGFPGRCAIHAHRMHRAYARRALERVLAAGLFRAEQVADFGGTQAPAIGGGSNRELTVVTLEIARAPDTSLGRAVGTHPPGHGAEPVGKSPPVGGRTP
jgi:hypothetical protein